ITVPRDKASAHKRSHKPEGKMEQVTLQTIFVSGAGNRTKLLVPIASHIPTRVEEDLGSFATLLSQVDREHSMPQPLAIRWGNLKMNPLPNSDDTWHSVISSKLPDVRNPKVRTIYSHLQLLYSAYHELCDCAEAYAGRLHPSALRDKQTNFRLKFGILKETTSKTYSRFVEHMLRFIVQGTILEEISGEPILFATDKQRTLFRVLVSQLETNSPKKADIQQLIYTIGVSLLETTLPEEMGISSVIEQSIAVKYITSSPQSRRIPAIKNEISKARRFFAIVFFYKCYLLDRSKEEMKNGVREMDGDVIKGNGNREKSDGEREGDNGNHGDDNGDYGDDDANFWDDHGDGDGYDEDGSDNEDDDGEDNDRDVEFGDQHGESESARISQASSFEDYQGLPEQQVLETTVAETVDFVAQDQLRFYCEYLNPKANHNSCAARLYDLWGAVEECAKIEPPAVNVSWTAGLSSFSIADGQGHIITKPTQFSDLQKTSQAAATEPLRMLQTLLLYSEERLTQIFRELMDNDDPFSSDRNRSIFEKTCQQLSQRLSTSGLSLSRCNNAGLTIAVDEGHAFLASTYKLLVSLLVGIAYTSGIPPRGFQIERLRYKKKDNEKTNIILRASSESGHRVFIAFPNAKQHKSAYNVAWLLPPNLGMALVLYLGIIRPIEIQLLENIQAHRGKLALLESHIFAAPTTSSEDSAKFGCAKLYVEEILGREALRMNCRVLRQLMTSLLRMKNPQFHGNSSETALDHSQPVLTAKQGSCDPELVLNHAVELLAWRLAGDTAS
ncbi:hypothetical protein EST38_g9718, partial [Candolleomyces aberdarensis]